MPKRPGEIPLSADITGSVTGQAPLGGIAEQTAAEYVRRLTHTETPAEEGARESIARTEAALRRGFQPATDMDILHTVVTATSTPVAGRRSIAAEVVAANQRILDHSETAAEFHARRDEIEGALAEGRRGFPPATSWKLGGTSVTGHST